MALSGDRALAQFLPSQDPGGVSKVEGAGFGYRNKSNGNRLSVDPEEGAPDLSGSHQAGEWPRWHMRGA